MTRQQEARKLTDDAKKLVLQMGRTHLALGKIFSRVRDGKFYKEAGYESFADWAQAVADIGRSWAYTLADLYTEVEATVPAEAIPTITVENAKLLVKLPENKRSDPTTLAAAQEMTGSEFHDYVDKAHPGLHIEKRHHETYWLSDDDHKIVEMAIKLAMARYGMATKSEALAKICEDFLNSEGEEIPGKQADSPLMRDIVAATERAQ
jgi:hypothetical protein